MFLMEIAVLINNAGIALPEGEPQDYRAVWSEVFNVNVFSVRVISELFLPLLRKSDDPRIINISSARGSFDRVTTGSNPPMTNCPYSTSKAALNMVTVDMANKNPDVTFHAVNPGHCKTAFNGFRGVKDPLDGGTAAAEVALAEKGKYKAGFWEDEGKGMQQIGW
jgi:NAD(P)-dependent dehydrogenase (short-subunit alcohol dehydrogenase family)